MSHYSRKQKTTSAKTKPSEHISKGWTAFQKTLATIGSLLGIVTASITILNYLNNNKKSETPSSTTTTTTIIREIERSTEPLTSTSESTSTETTVASSHDAETSSSFESTSTSSTTEETTPFSSETVTEQSSN